MRYAGNLSERGGEVHGIAVLIRRREVIILLVAGVLVRLIMAAAYHPAPAGDAASYVALAHDLRAWDLSSDTGIRTPLYPALIALVNADASRVYEVQAVLGLVISLMLYLYFGLITNSVRWGLAAGLVYGLNLTSLIFEQQVLTETFTTLLVVGALLVSVWVLRVERPGLTPWTVLGLLGGMAALTRPNFLAFAIVLVMATALVWSLRRRASLGAVLRRAGIGLLPVLLLVGGWSCVNYARFHWFTPSTITGFALMDEAQSFIEDRPSRYGKIAEIYAQQVRAHPGQNVTWTALPVVEKQTGLSQVQVSRELVGICTRLFFDHPVEYVKGVLKVLPHFFSPPLALFHRPQRGLGKLLLNAYVDAYFAADVVLLFAFALGILSTRVRTSGWWPDFVVFAALLLCVLLSTVPVDIGSPSRYKLPLEALLFGWTMVLSRALLIDSRKETPALAPPEPSL